MDAKEVKQITPRLTFTTRLTLNRIKRLIRKSAKLGYRSLVYSYFPPVIQSVLRKKGFRVVPDTGDLKIMW